MSAAQTINDAEVLARFEELIDLDGQTRAARLEALFVEDPLLHARLVRMLAAATDGTRVLAEPIVDELLAMQTAAALLPEPGHAVNGYRLLREIGRGGMSSVWLAERTDGIVKRNVALKLPLFALTSSLAIARFEQEREVLAGLAHPHIARLYDAGVTAGGQPFIVLEYINGSPITEFCDTHRLSIRQRLELFLQVLAAVEHAHKHLIVHRDLKPSNILVDMEGEVKLLDFGIAKLLAEPGGGAAPHTQLGSAALTPLYSAPEQIAQRPISTLTDIYVLGLVLYELLTGVLPYVTEEGHLPSLEQVLEAQVHGTNRPPSKAIITDGAAQARDLADAGRLRKSCKGDLDTIVQKALRHDPEQRYSSVERFARDIRRFLQQRPITARPPGVGYVTRLFLKRHPNASVAVAAGLLLAVTASSIAWQRHIEAKASAARAVAVRDFMFDLIIDAEPSELQPDVPVTAKQMVANAVQRARRDFGDQPQLRGEILGDLGRMYLRLDETQLAMQMLNEALELLKGHSRPTDAALNKARAYLAYALREQGLAGRARANELALAARNQCTQRTIECAKVRSYADSIIGMLRRLDGQLEESLVAMRSSVEEAVRGFGADNPDVAMALMNLAIAARRAGRIQEADAAIERATTITASQTLLAADRLQLKRTHALIHIDMGRYARARQQLDELLRGLLSDRERGLQLSMLAMVLLEQGESAAAIAAAEAGIALLVGPNSSPSVATVLLQALARGHALLGRYEQAHERTTQVTQLLRERSVAADSPEVLRTQRILAETLLRAGRLSEALAVMEPLQARVGTLPAQQLEGALNLDMRGCILREMNRANEAIAAHARARSLLQKHLPAKHPFLVRNTLYEAAARKDSKAFDVQAQAFQRELPESSQWRRLIVARQEGSDAACTQAGLQDCVFVL